MNIPETTNNNKPTTELKHLHVFVYFFRYVFVEDMLGQTRHPILAETEEFSHIFSGLHRTGFLYLRTDAEPGSNAGPRSWQSEAR